MFKLAVALLVCYGLSLFRVACGYVLCVLAPSPVVLAFGLIECVMGTLSFFNALNARHIDTGRRGYVAPLIYTAGLYVAPQAGMGANLDALLWCVVVFRAWALWSLGLGVTCGVSTFIEFKTAGPYAWVRHPMQVSGIAARLIFCIAWPSPVNLLGLAMLTAGSVAIVLAEESFLRNFNGWQPYADRVRFRLFPGVW